MRKTPRIPIPVAVRHYVLERDRDRCQSCGKTKLETALHIDYIIPLARGGQNDISNLQTLCRHCNLKDISRNWVFIQTGQGFDIVFWRCLKKKHYLDPRFKRYFSR